MASGTIHAGIPIFRKQISGTTATTGGIGSPISTSDYIVIAAVPTGNTSYYSLTIGSYNGNWNFTAVANNGNLSALANTAITFDVYYIRRMDVVDVT